MKKLLCSLALLLAITLSVGAQSSASLIKHFKDSPEAEYVGIPSLVMSFMKWFADEDSEDGRTFKMINSLSVLDLESCSPEVRTRFAREAKALQKNGYDLLTEVKDDGNWVQILIKEKRNKIRELLVLSLGDDCALVKIGCNINREDAARLADVQIKKK